MSEKLPPEIRERLKFKFSPKEDRHIPIRVDVVHEPKPCEDCGKIVKDRRTWYKQYTKPFPHWHEYCKNCSKVKNPLTQQWDIPANSVNVWLKNNQDKLEKDK